MALLAAYNFDEASGAILDRSGNGRDVTFGGSLTRVAGHTNTALSQSTTAIDSNGPALTGMQTAAYTIMGWVRRSSNSLDGWLMEFKQSSSGDRGVLFISGAIQSRCKNVAGSVFTAAVTQPTAGTPYHFACTNDGSSLKLFINGSQVASTAFSGGVRTNSTSSSFIDALGSETWLDDARYYDTALDAATITTLMNTPVDNGGTTLTLDRATEADTARALAYAKTVPLSLAAETETARSVTLSKALQFGKASESGTARQMSLAKILAALGAAESDQARALALTKARALQVTGETDTALAMTFLKALTLARATETNTARAVELGGSGLTLGVASETDTAWPIGWTKSVLLARAAETDAGHAWSAGALTPYVAALVPTATTRRLEGTAVTRDQNGTATTGEAI